MTSFAIRTFGCRVNQSEALAWADDLQQRGMVCVEDPARCGLILVNTCTLTSRADRDVRAFLRKVGRENPRAKMVVTGCYAERAREELKKFPGVWRVVPNRGKAELTSRVLGKREDSKQGSIQKLRSRAFLKIQDGCSLRCSFCIIPRVRGKSASVPRREILRRAAELTERGFREIVLTGVHLGLYGREAAPRDSLLGLLQDLERVPGLGRIRLSSLDPRFLDTAIMEHITKSSKICPHFHLSLQHGSDRVLSRMNRRARVCDYREVLETLRRRSPQAALGADIIVGFPGETEDDFARMKRFLEDSPLTSLHVFAYSPRPGTPAAAWPRVNSSVTTRRSAELRQMAAEKTLRFHRLWEGAVLDAVVIQRSNGTARVLTSNFIDVHIPAGAAEEGMEVRVRITKAGCGRTTGILERESP